MKFLPLPHRLAFRLAAVRRAFSLVEVMITVSLLSLIVLMLMNVFSNTQSAFRAAVTQSDVLEGGRSAMELIAQDLRLMTKSYDYSNGAVNFFSSGNYNRYYPLVQSLPASSGQRTNLLNYFFILQKDVNNNWQGIGYVVDNTNETTLYPLYRYSAKTNASYSPLLLYNQFLQFIVNGQWTNMSHIMDGVVHLVARPQDPGGFWINNNASTYTNALNTRFAFPAYGETQFFMFSNTLPAAVELQFSAIEDRVLRRADPLPTGAPASPPNDRRTQYLSSQSGHTQIFRQLVRIPNVDLSAYQ